MFSIRLHKLMISRSYKPQDLCNSTKFTRDVGSQKNLTGCTQESEPKLSTVSKQLQVILQKIADSCMSVDYLDNSRYLTLWFPVFLKVLFAVELKYICYMFLTEKQSLLLLLASELCTKVNI